MFILSNLVVFCIMLPMDKGYLDINKLLKNTLKRSRVGDPTPEGSLTLVSNLLWVVVNRGLDILGNLTKLNITKY